MERKDKKRPFANLPTQPKKVTAIDPKTGIRASGLTRGSTRAALSRRC